MTAKALPAPLPVRNTDDTIERRRFLLIGIALRSSRVSSARAAEIVGIGYEGFRSYLKRGLLDVSGCCLAFIGQELTRMTIQPA